MAIFKRKHLNLVLQGTKTQTRRVHKRLWTVGRIYAVRDRWFTKPAGYILITRRFRQRLGDITPKEIEKEGYKDVGEYKKIWEEIWGPGSWNPDLVVTVYEFVLHPTEDKKNT